MALEKTQAELDAQIDAGIKVNGNKEITPPIHNAIEKALVNSLVNKKEGGSVMQADFGQSTYIAPSQDTHFTPKKYVDDALLTINSFTAWSSLISYIPGDTVYNAGLIWYATGASTNEIPGIGANWSLLITNTAVYDTTTWNGSVLSPTQDAVRDKFESLGSTYLPLAGGTMSGDINMGSNDINNGGIITAIGGLSTDGIASIFIDTVNSVTKIGYLAGSGSLGVRVTAIGLQAAMNNTRNDVLAVGDGAAGNNTGTAIALFGPNCGYGNSANLIYGFGDSCLYNNTGTQAVAMGTAAGFGQTGAHVFLVGNDAGRENDGSYVSAIGNEAAKDNTRNYLFTVSNIKDVFLNNIGDKGYTALWDVTLQTAMSLDGTNTSAALSQMIIAAARGTGTGAAGDVLFKYSVPEASGTTRQSLGLAATMDGETGVFSFEKDLSAKSINQTSTDANNKVVQNKILKVDTTGAVATELTTDGTAGSGSTNRISVPTNVSMSVVVNICVKQSGSANSKQMLRQFLIVNNAGTTTIEGAVTLLGTDVGSIALAAAAVTITANNTDDCIKIEGTGIVATNLRWTAYIVSTEVLYV